MTEASGSDHTWGQEFVTLLSSSQPADWDRARELKLQNMPARLFRYRRPVETSFAALERNTIWLSAADLLNDVHDTSVSVDSPKTLESLLRDALANGTHGLPPELAERLASGTSSVLSALDAVFEAEIRKQHGPEVASKAKDFFRSFAAREGEKMTERTSRFVQRATKVACFCESEDIRLLWAHYADGHRGFCVEYPFDGIPRDDLRVQWLVPVVYTAERFNLSTLMETHGRKPNPFVPFLAAIHKAPEWAYEREWRIVAPIGDEAPGLELTMPKPTRLLLGSRMEPGHRGKLLSIARSQGVPVHEMVSGADGFTLESRAVVDAS